MTYTAYQILQVQENACPEVIEAAWKALVKLFHPDTNPGVNLKILQAINSAHDALSPQNRPGYDAMLTQNRMSTQLAAQMRQTVLNMETKIWFGEWNKW